MPPSQVTVTVELLHGLLYFLKLTSESFCPGQKVETEMKGRGIDRYLSFCTSLFSAILPRPSFWKSLVPQIRGTGFLVILGTPKGG